MHYKHTTPVCGRRCRRPLLCATVVGMVDFMLPACGFLAGDDMAVAWLGLIGRVGDVVGFLPIVVQAFRYAESTASTGGGPRVTLPRENPWLFWKFWEKDMVMVDDDGESLQRL